MKASTRALGFIVLLVLVAACAAHQPAFGSYPDAPGFFKGVWHGLIVPFAFAASIFTDVRIYAWPNTGVWYDLGFLIGIGAWGGGAAASR